jgi:hypothetical protein
MSSPAHRPPSAVTSHGRTDSKGAAIRRGDLKISDPIQLPHGVSHGISQQSTLGTPSNPVTPCTPPLEDTWPTKSVSPASHTRTRSNGANESQGQHAASSNVISRISAAPSAFNGGFPSTPSKESLNKQKDGGFRAKIRRMFGSRRLREPTLSSCTGGHHSQTVSSNRTPSSFSLPLCGLRNANLLLHQPGFFNVAFGCPHHINIFVCLSLARACICVFQS